MATESGRPLQLGELAPDFTLVAVDREGTVSLSDYRGKSPLLLGLFRGLWCPFCRRSIARMGNLKDQLRDLGVDMLGVVATSAENARLYFQFHPTRLPLAADPDLLTHRSYGLPKPEVTPELLRQLETISGNPTGELPAPVPLVHLAEALDQTQGFQPTDTDRGDRQRQFPQLKGQFLVDRAGIVRWLNIECTKEGIAGLGKFPTDEELLAAARTMLT